MCVEIVGLGFESIEPFFWQTMNKDLPAAGHGSFARRSATPT